MTRRPDTTTSPRFPLWVGYAVASFICYGVTNSLLGGIFEWSGRNPDAPVTAPFVVWLTMGFVGAAAAGAFKRGSRGVQNLRPRRLLWVPAVAGVCLSAGMLTLALGMASDPRAKGPIVALTSTNAMIVTLAAWFILRERLSRGPLFGILIIICGIAVMALGAGGGSSLLGVVFGLASMVLFGLTGFLVKYAGHRGSHWLTTTTVLWLAAGFCGILAVGYCLIRYGGLPGLNQASLLLWSAGAGLTLSAGMLFLSLAMGGGPGGPVAAITGCSSIVVVLFEFSVFGHVPPAAKFAGMAVAMAGIMVLSLTARQKAATPGGEAPAARRGESSFARGARS